MNIALIGYGKMGKELERLAPGQHLVVKKIFASRENAHGSALTKQSLSGIDVCIEFTTPKAVINNIEAVAACGKNIIVGTTGWHDRLDDVKKLVKEKKIGLLYAANFSLGMNAFQHILSSAAHLFDKLEAYDAAISETHHKDKPDSPSGTALALGQILLQNIRRKKSTLTDAVHGHIKEEQLHISSTRVGSVIGEHRVVFDSDADTIELTHSAKNRSGFALGALVAAEWLKGKKGFYTMKDVLASMI